MPENTDTIIDDQERSSQAAHDASRAEDLSDELRDLAARSTAPHASEQHRAGVDAPSATEPTPTTAEVTGSTSDLSSAEASLAAADKAIRDAARSSADPSIMVQLQAAREEAAARVQEARDASTPATAGTETETTDIAPTTIEDSPETRQMVIEGQWGGPYTVNGRVYEVNQDVQYQERDGDVVTATLLGFVGGAGETPSIVLQISEYGGIKFVTSTDGVLDFRDQDPGVDPGTSPGSDPTEQQSPVTGPPREPGATPGPEPVPPSTPGVEPPAPNDPEPTPPTPPGPPAGPPAPGPGPVEPPTPGTGPGEQQLPTEPVDPELAAAKAYLDQGVGVLGDHTSERQRAYEAAGDEFDREKAKLDAKRQEYFEKHPNVAKSVVGKAFLNLMHTGRHPIQSIWKQNLMRDAYIQKTMYDFLEGGSRHDEIALSESGVDATVSRLAGAQKARAEGDERSASMLEHASTGESLESTERPEVVALKQQVSELVKQFVTTDMDQAEFQAQKDRLIAEGATWIQGRTERKGEATVEAIDNITKFAEQLKIVFEHTQSMEAVDERLATMQFVTGESRTGARTQAELPRVNRIIDKMRARGVGVVVNEKTLAVGIAAAGALLTRGSTSVASRALKYGTFGLGSAIAGAGAFRRERRTVATERARVGRQRAAGKQGAGVETGPDGVLASTPERNELTETLYSVTESSTVMAEFDALIEPIAEDGTGMTAAQAQSIIDTLVRRQAEIRWGDLNGVDVVRYSSEDHMEAERLAIDSQMVQMQNFLEVYYSEHPDALPDGFTSFEQMLEVRQTNERYSLMEETQEAKDKRFDAYSKKRAYTRAALTVAGGVIGGAVVKYGLEHGASALGLTWLAEGRTPRPLPNEHNNVYGLDVAMPKGWHFQGEPNGTTLLDARGNVVAENLQTNPDTGGFTPDSIKLLEGKGMHIDSNPVVVDGPPRIETYDTRLAHMNPRIQRFWQDNNTEAPRFDLNELKTHWRVEGDKIVVDVRSMTGKGSFHGGRFVNAPQEILNGNAKVLISATKDSQSTPFAFDIAPDGTLRIPTNSDVARNFFELQNGQIAGLKGAYLEIASGRGTAPDGRIQYDILSTVVGKNNITEFTSEVPTSRTLVNTVITAMDKGGDPNNDFPIFFVPLPLSRFGLENIPPERRQQEDQPERGGTAPSGPGTGEGSGGQRQFHEPGTEPSTGIIDTTGRPGVPTRIAGTPTGAAGVAGQPPRNGQTPVEAPPTSAGVGGQLPPFDAVLPRVVTATPPQGGEGNDTIIGQPTEPTPVVSFPGQQVPVSSPVETGSQGAQPGSSVEQAPIPTVYARPRRLVLEAPPTDAISPRELEAGEATAIPELPVRAESLLKIRDAETAIDQTATAMKLGGLNPESTNFLDLSDRIKRNLYTKNDLNAMRTLLELAQENIQKRGQQDGLEYLPELQATIAYYDKLDREFDAEKMSARELVSSIKDIYKVHETLGFLADSPQQAYGRFGNMLQRVSRGELLKSTEYQWMMNIVQQSFAQSEATLQARKQDRMDAARTDEARELIERGFDANFRRLYQLRDAKEAALASLFARAQVVEAENAPAPEAVPQVSTPEVSAAPPAAAAIGPAPVVVNGQSLQAGTSPDGRVVFTDAGSPGIAQPPAAAAIPAQTGQPTAAPSPVTPVAETDQIAA